MKQKIALVLHTLFFVIATAYFVTFLILGVVPALHLTLWSLEVVCFAAILILQHQIREEEKKI